VKDAFEQPNKEMKLTSVERIGRSQLIPGVGQTLGREGGNATQADRMRHACLWAIACALLSCRAEEQLPKPRSGSVADPDEAAMQLAVMQNLVSTNRSAALCVKIWPQALSTGPVPLPVRFADLPDPADSMIRQLPSLGTTVLRGSACKVARSGNTVAATGARASAAILHGVVWEGGAAKIIVDTLEGIDGYRTTYRVTPVGTGFRAELQE